VNRPDTPAKNEYQSLVSPIVLNGGRRREIHMPKMNAASTRIDATEKATAPLRRAQSARTDAITEHTMDGRAKNNNISQVIIFEVR
jgi:hypothetical protein